MLIDNKRTLERLMKGGEEYMERPINAKKKTSKKKEKIPGLEAIIKQGKNYRSILKRYSKK